MSKISRSEYQRVVEENKRLLADIEVLVSGGPESILLAVKWANKFKEDKEFSDRMKAYVRGYLSNPDKKEKP